MAGGIKLRPGDVVTVCSTWAHERTSMFIEYSIRVVDGSGSRAGQLIVAFGEDAGEPTILERGTVSAGLLDTTLFAFFAVRRVAGDGRHYVDVKARLGSGFRHTLLISSRMDYL